MHHRTQFGDGPKMTGRKEPTKSVHNDYLAS